MVARARSTRADDGYGFKVRQVTGPVLKGEKAKIIHLYEVYLQAIEIRQSSIDGFVKQAIDNWGTEKESTTFKGFRAVVAEIEKGT